MKRPLRWSFTSEYRTPIDTLTSDKIEGARAIADFLGYEGTEGERKVRHLRARSTGCPIRKRVGIGIYAFKSELTAWLAAEETLPGRRPA